MSAEIPDSESMKARPSRLAFMLRALKSRNYRLFFSGQIVSLVGNWMTSVTTAWVVYDLTHSGWWLGLTGFAAQFPTFVIAPVAGALVDRWNLQRVLVFTQILAMLQSLALAILALTGHLQVEYLIILSLVQGFINAFDLPARQSFVVQILDDRSDLPNAIALNSSMVNGARLLGPAIAGVLLATTGAGICYLLDALSYVGVIIALIAIRVAAQAPKPAPAPVLESIKEGFRISFGFAPIRAVLVLMSIVSIAGVPYMVLMPIFARDILHGGPQLMGMLTGSVGVGALAGAVYLASRKTVVGISKALAGASATFGVALILFSFSRSIPLSLAILPLAGASMIIQMAGSNTLLQTLAEDHQRGRVMAMFTMCFMGTVPIGNLLCGALSEHLGAPTTVMIGGVFCIVGAIIFWIKRPSLRPLVWPIYQRRGIIPEVAAGIRTASAATDDVS